MVASAVSWNSDWMVPLGQKMRATSARVASPRPTWTMGEVMGVALHVQAGADLDFPADAERVDALIAEHRGRLRPDDLIVVRLGAAVLRDDGDAALVDANQIEPPVAIEIGGRAGPHRQA